MPITEKQLSSICPAFKGAYLTSRVNAINRITPLYDMDKPDILEEFIPNLLEESGELSRFSESLNYSTEALVKLFGRHRISLNDASRYGRNSAHPANQVMIANTIYGGDWGKVNLGNTQPNDGWDYKGSGAIQITGRLMTTKFTDYYNKKNSTNYSPQRVAELMRDGVNIDVALHSACWFFAIAKGLIPMAINDEFKAIVKRINGGYNGLENRTRYYTRAKSAFAA